MGNETIDLGGFLAAASAPLPFRTDEAATAHALEGALGHGGATQRPVVSPAASGGTLDLGAFAAAPNAEAPPAESARPGVQAPELTLEQYASLCVELSLAPDQVPQTLHRYRVSPEARALLDARWRERFAADPGQRAAFALAFATDKAMISDRRG